MKCIVQVADELNIVGLNLIFIFLYFLISQSSMRLFVSKEVIDNMTR